jgi:hypothetical protein
MSEKEQQQQKSPLYNDKHLIAEKSSRKEGHRLSDR